MLTPVPGVTTAPSTVAELSRIRWRCRRGMRELDVMLSRYLDEVYADADAAEQAAFERLLECQDPQIWAWLLGRGAPFDADLALVIQRIRRLNLPAGG